MKHSTFFLIIPLQLLLFFGCYPESEEFPESIMVIHKSRKKDILDSVTHIQDRTKLQIFMKEMSKRTEELSKFSTIYFIEIRYKERVDTILGNGFSVKQNRKTYRLQKSLPDILDEITNLGDE